jgi:hypothetical protein
MHEINSQECFSTPQELVSKLSFPKLISITVRDSCTRLLTETEIFGRSSTVAARKFSASWILVAKENFRPLYNYTTQCEIN